MGHTLDELEGVEWGEPEFDSHLVTTCHRLRKKPIDAFSTEDLRIMIGQNIGLQYLLPLALDVLTEDPLASGDYYPGDLLHAVIGIEPSFLQAHPELTNRIVSAARNAVAVLCRDDTNLREQLASFVEKWTPSFN